MTRMTSNKPYLIKAFYQWIVDNNMTPYLVVDASAPNIQIPIEYVQNGMIVMNISPSACRGLFLELDRIVFTAKFGGIATQVSVTPASVLEIYARENGRGIIFTPEDGDDSPPPADPTPIGKKGAKPSLKIVK